MGYLLNEEQQGLLDMVADFCEKEVKPYAAEWDEKGIVPMETYQKALDMGLHILEIPEEYGGGGIDYITVAAICEEMAKACAGFYSGIVAAGLGMKPVLLHGTPAQIQQFTDVVAAGKFSAFGLTEPGAGSDAGSVRTTAVRDGDEYVLNGTKCFITNGGIADIYVIFASTDKSKGVKGLSAFIVDRNTPGFSTGKEENKMGIRASDTCELILEDVRIPAANLLGKEGEGFKIAMQTLDLARPLVGAGAVGVAQRALDEALKYSKERVQFGKPISALQVIQFKMADMAIGIETARQMNIYALRLYEAKKPFSKEAAIAKCYSGDVAFKCAAEAIQIMGGYGYSREYPVEKLLRDAKIFQIYEGTNEVQRAVIAGQLMR